MPATYEKIATYTVPSAQSTVTFSSIPATYTDLILMIGGAATAAQGMALWYNNDTTLPGVYSRTYLYGDGTSAVSARASGGGANHQILEIGTAISTVYAHIMNYSNTTTFKTALSRGGSASNLTITGVGLWRNTSAINRLDIATVSGTMNTGTVLTVYGIKAA
jgi:hypothetical protein